MVYLENLMFRDTKTEIFGVAATLWLENDDFTTKEVQFSEETYF